MALQMTYTAPEATTDGVGVEYPKSYWVVDILEIRRVDMRAVLVLTGYRDAEARKAGAAPIGQKRYEVAGDEFAGLMKQTLESGARNIAALAYGFAKEQREGGRTERRGTERKAEVAVPDLDEEGQSVLDKGGNPVTHLETRLFVDYETVEVPGESFFAAAEDV